MLSAIPETTLTYINHSTHPIHQLISTFFTKKYTFILMSGNLLVNKTDSQALLGPTVTGLVQDPLAITRLKTEKII